MVAGSVLFSELVGVRARQEQEQEQEEMGRLIIDVQATDCALACSCSCSSPHSKDLLHSSVLLNQLQRNFTHEHLSVKLATPR